MSGRFFHQQPINGEKAWLDSAVRRLSHVAVSKGQGQEVWITPPGWWSRECKHPWKNPTSPTQKDTLQTLRDRFTCLEQHLRKENKIPADMEEEITLWKEKQLPNLFFLTHLSCLLGQIIKAGQSLNELKVPKIRSPHVQRMLDELHKTEGENFLKIETFIKNQINQADSELQREAESGHLLRKRPLTDESTSEGLPLVSGNSKRPKHSSSLSPIPLHSPGSLSSSGVSIDASFCNDTFMPLDSTDSEKDTQDILSHLSTTNTFVQSTNSGCAEKLTTNFKSSYLASSLSEQSSLLSSKAIHTVEPFVNDTSDGVTSSVNLVNLTTLCLGDSSQLADNEASCTPSLLPTFNSPQDFHKPDTTSFIFDKNVSSHHRQAEVSRSLSVSSNGPVKSDDANNQRIINTPLPLLLSKDEQDYLISELLNIDDSILQYLIVCLDSQSDFPSNVT